jgi:cell division septum initiation protein DivIVA
MGEHKHNGGKRKAQVAGHVPDFDIVLWGYDREQVRRCLDDMTVRLEEALGRLDSVEVLQSELCDAQVEIEQLRQAAEEEPSLAGQISKIMSVAEQLRCQAEQDAEAIRAGARGNRGKARSGTRAEAHSGQPAPAASGG